MSTSTGPGRAGYQQPAEATGRLTGDVGYVIALAVTAGADFAAFYQVLSRILQDLGSSLVAVAVAGFTVMSLALAHFTGQLLRDRKAGYGPDHHRAARLLLLPWAVLGLSAFAVRLIFARSQAAVYTPAGFISPSTQQMTSAFLFLSLYLASGAVAGFGEYLTRNPYRAHYRGALRAYHRSLRRLSRSQPPYERALSIWQLQAGEYEAQEANSAVAAELHAANADELKRYAAVLIAAHLQDPSATDGMTITDRRPDPHPPPERPGVPGPAPDRVSDPGRPAERRTVPGSGREHATVPGLPFPAVPQPTDPEGTT
jgi:hypothetical protein